jgi:hypothetical protein
MACALRHFGARGLNHWQLGLMSRPGARVPDTDAETSPEVNCKFRNRQRREALHPQI